jgi:hypothetical protein
MPDTVIRKAAKAHGAWSCEGVLFESFRFFSNSLLSAKLPEEVFDALT